jgi:hypothetical protein
MCVRFAAAATLLILCAAPVVADDHGEQAPPFKIQVAGKPLDVGGVGYAAPFVGDFDGDGLRDLLVGQFSEGKLRIYRNEGTALQPKFEKFLWFMDDKPEGRVPTG